MSDSASRSDALESAFTLDTKANTTTPSPEPHAESADDILDQARRFLATEEVKNADREKKVSFLKTKGLSDGIIEKLLSEGQEAVTSPSSQSQAQASTSAPASTTPAHTSSSFPSAPTNSSLPAASTAASMPPIITYPEFLVSPARPAPLITMSRLTNILYGSAVAGATLYGASKFVVQPMLQTQTSARESLAEGTNSKLIQLVNKLEDVVSVIPPTPHHKRSHKGAAKNCRGMGTGDEGEGVAEDWDSRSIVSDASDPTELFHRDIGTQTSDSLPNTPTSPPSPQKTPSESQNERLSKLTSNLKELCEGLVGQGEDTEQIGTLVDLLREDLDKLSYPPPYGGGSSSYSIYGYPGVAHGEPNDEIKKSKEEIRRLKGVLLSARTFPASTR